MGVFHKPGYPIDQVYWYLKSFKLCKPLRHSLSVDVVIVGGGMAGLHVAYAFKKKGLNVALVEESFCGGGASGKSSGFITPNSELGLEHFYTIYGPEKANIIWQFVTSGVETIRSTIKEYAIGCDYNEQSTVVFANNNRGMKEITREHKARVALNYESTLCNGQGVAQIVGSKKYKGANKYNDTFGINPFSYIQFFKVVLMEMGVHIFEETPVLTISDHSVKTEHHEIKAQNIIVCADRFIPDLGRLKKEIYHVQTFLMISAPLSDIAIKKIFPEAPLMAWDTDLVYQYYRLTGENRLLLGGGSIWSSYWPWERHNAYTMYNKLNNYWHKKFPNVDVHFEYMWPGMLGVSKDLMPIAGTDKDQKHIYYIGAATGLPWAAALGNYCVERLLDKRTDMDEYFSPYRSFLIGGFLQTILRNPLTFALCDFYNAKVRGLWR